jgi:hypothetical protein
VGIENPGWCLVLAGMRQGKLRHGKLISMQDIKGALTKKRVDTCLHPLQTIALDEEGAAIRSAPQPVSRVCEAGSFHRNRHNLFTQALNFNQVGCFLRP